MAVIRRRLLGKNQTGAEMHRLINRYYKDLDSVTINGVPFSRLPINEAFDTVRLIPYRRDNKPVEVLARPSKILLSGNVGMDCKKKTIVLASYLKGRDIPYRLVASSRLPSKRVHHVFPQMMFGSRWLNLDATYRNYRPFKRKFVSHWEII